MKIWHISDTHLLDEKLVIPPNIDILIHSGDAANNRSIFLNEKEFLTFWTRFEKLPIKYKVFVPGNHDGFLEHAISTMFKRKVIDHQYVTDTYLLIDDWIQIMDIKIYGSPWTPEFNGWSFMKKREKINKVWENLPEDIDILVTHGPPKGILDLNGDIIPVGDSALFKRVMKIQPKFHLFGHVHSNRYIINAGVRSIPNCRTIFSNGSCQTDGKRDELTSNGNVLIYKDNER